MSIQVVSDIKEDQSYFSRSITLGASIFRGIFKVLAFPFVIRDRYLWNRWEKAQRALFHNAGSKIGLIVRVRQNARTGTKAYIRWHDEEEKEAIWIPKSHPGHSYIVARGSYGYGDHHNETVFYVNELIDVLSSSSYRGWKRHNKREEKKELQKHLEGS